MSRPLDLTDRRFGMLVALQPTEARKGTSVVWECRCDCGNLCFYSVKELTHGNPYSCGCTVFNHTLPRSTPYPNGPRGPNRDLTGKSFGFLDVLGLDPERAPDGKYRWKVFCRRCRQTKSLTADRLRQTNYPSCGCRNVQLLDLTGQRFGHLTVLRKTALRKRTFTVYECRCDCGVLVQYSTQELRHYHKTSCGCQAA